MTFVDSGQEFGDSMSTSVALADLNGDDTLDAFVGHYGPNMVWFNDGHGRFTDSGQRLGETPSLDVDMADFDGDGDLDALVANGPFHAERRQTNSARLRLCCGLMPRGAGTSSQAKSRCELPAGALCFTRTVCFKHRMCSRDA